MRNVNVLADILYRKTEREKNAPEHTKNKLFSNKNAQFTANDYVKDGKRYLLFIIIETRQRSAHKNWKI